MKKGVRNTPFFRCFYPDKGNFVGFVCNLQSRSLLKKVIGKFRKKSTFPSEAVTAPQWVTGINWSDHWSFWEFGYDALMITDTALYRYDNYHTSEDTWEKLDYQKMARVVCDLYETMLAVFHNESADEYILGKKKKYRKQLTLNVKHLPMIELIIITISVVLV